MHVVAQRCAGLAVHKRTVVACVVVRQTDGRVAAPVRTFGTLTGELVVLSGWLRELPGERVALERTGVYWWPVVNLLEEDGLNVVLVNPKHRNAVPGRKPAGAASRWLGDLLRHGLLRASFIAPAARRHLRERTR